METRPRSNERSLNLAQAREGYNRGVCVCVCVCVCGVCVCLCVNKFSPETWLLWISNTESIIMDPRHSKTLETFCQNKSI